MLSTPTTTDPRLKQLKGELAKVAARPLRVTFKQPEDEDEREKYPTLAGVVKALVSQQDWRRSPIHQVTHAIRIAISRLPESMSGRPEGEQIGIPDDEVIGSNMWKGLPERYFAEVLYGERDRDVAARFGVQNERMSYKHHYRTLVLEIAKLGGPTNDRSARRMLGIIREDLALALLELTTEDLSLEQNIEISQETALPSEMPAGQMARILSKANHESHAGDLPEQVDQAEPTWVREFNTTFGPTRDRSNESSTTEHSWMIVTTRSGWTVITMAGEGDVYTAPFYRDGLLSLYRLGKLTKLVIEINMNYTDSTYLGVLVGQMRRSQANGGVLRFIAGNRHVVMALRITKLDTIFRLFTDVDQATALPITDDEWGQ